MDANDPIFRHDSIAVVRAVVDAVNGVRSISGAARHYQVARSSVHACMARHGLESPGRPTGVSHHAWRGGVKKAEEAHALRREACPLCGGQPRAMPTHCPARPLRPGELQSILMGIADYRAGRWTGTVLPDAPTASPAGPSHGAPAP